MVAAARLRWSSRPGPAGRRPDVAQDAPRRAGRCRRRCRPRPGGRARRPTSPARRSASPRPVADVGEPRSAIELSPGGGVDQLQHGQVAAGVGGVDVGVGAPSPDRSGRRPWSPRRSGGSWSGPARRRRVTTPDPYWWSRALCGSLRSSGSAGRVDRPPPPAAVRDLSGRTRRAGPAASGRRPADGGTWCCGRRRPRRPTARPPSMTFWSCSWMARTRSRAAARQRRPGRGDRHQEQSEESASHGRSSWGRGTGAVPLFYPRVGPARQRRLQRPPAPPGRTPRSSRPACPCPTPWFRLTMCRRPPPARRHARIASATCSGVPVRSTSSSTLPWKTRCG